MINIDDKTRRLSQATIVIGYKKENKAESIEFKIPDYLKEYGKKICFKTKDGKVFSKLFDNTTSNIFTFTRTETQYGELDATIQFFKSEDEDIIVYKTSMLHIIFKDAVICEDEIQPDDPKYPILEDLIIKVSNITKDITTINKNIEDIDKKNNEQDTKIKTNETDIADIKKVNIKQDNNIKELQTENEQLKNQIPQGEATGNPIHLTDSSDLECEIVPIGGAEQETREGYNLGKYNVGTKTVNGVTFTHNEDDSMTINGTPIGYIWFDMSDGVLLKAGTYTFAIEYYNLASGDDQVQVINKTLDKTIKSLYATNTVQSNKKVVEFTLEEDAVCMLRYYCRQDDTINNQKLYAMILNGSYTVDTLPAFEPYGATPSPDYPSEVVTVGQNGSVEIKVDNGLETTDTNYQSYTKVLPIQQEMLEGDYIEDVEHHGWGKYEITGNENWKKSGNQNNISYYLIINSILVNIDGNTIPPSSSGGETKVAIVLSNHFKAISLNQLFEGSENGICLNWYGGEKQMRLGFGLDSDINTVDKLKAWLKSLYDAGTPVIVYYKLATPKSLELTEDQKSVLNSFYTYKGITNISVDGIGTLKVNYKKDLETMFNNIIKQMPSSTSDTTET